MIWMKLYNLCKEQKDIEVALVAATSISDEKKRETALGGLLEDLIVHDSLKKIFN